MSVMSSNVEEFLKLYHGFVLVGSKLLRRYIEFILEHRYNGAFFHSFIHRKKHYLFHVCKGFKVCCFCYKPIERSSTSSVKLNTSVFDRLYEEVKPYKCLNKGNIMQSDFCNNNNNNNHIKCICKFVPNTSVSIDDLDITDLCTLILVENKENEEVVGIRSIRNDLSHHPDIERYLDYEQYWNNIFKHFHSLAKEVGKDYWEVVEVLLTQIRTNRMHPEDQRKVKDRREDDRKHDKELQTCFQDTIGIVATFNQVTADCTLCKPHRDSMTTKLTAVIETLPESWDKNRIIANLNNRAMGEDFKSDDLQIVSAKDKCIELYIKASEKAFQDKDTFKKAIEKLLQRIIEAGHIDSSVPANINIEIECQQKGDHIESEHGVRENFELRLPQHSFAEIGFLTSIVLDVFPNILREVVVYFSDYQIHLSEVSELDLEELGIKVFELMEKENVGDITIAEDIKLMQYIKREVFHRKSSYVGTDEMNTHVENILAIASRFDSILLKTETCFKHETECLRLYWFADSRALGIEHQLIGSAKYSTASSVDSGFDAGKDRVKKSGKKKKNRKAAITDTVSREMIFTPYPTPSTDKNVVKKEDPETEEIKDKTSRAITIKDDVQGYIQDEDCVTDV